MDPPSARLAKKASLGMKCMKYMLIVINVLYVIVSMLMISGATTLKVLFGQYYFIVWSNHTVDDLSSLWIATGVFLMLFSIFGMVAAIKQSTMLTNIYAVLLSLTFILQMAAAITGFTLMPQASSMTWHSLNSLMRDFDYNYDFRQATDWIQSTFQCCGIDGPADWNNIGQFTTPHSWPTSTDSWYTDDYYTPSTTETPSTIPPRTDFMPRSCCTRHSDYADRLCLDSYFLRGCHAVLRPIVSDKILMIGTSALIIGFIQIVGIICAFMLARAIRQCKTNRDIQRWTFHESMGFDRPAGAQPPSYINVGQEPVPESEPVKKPLPENGSGQY